jgi:structural maintenance of chromosome 4
MPVPLRLKISRRRSAALSKFGQLKAEMDECSQKTKLEKEASRVQAELMKLTHKEPDKRSQLSAARQKADEARASLSSTQSQGNVLTG